MVYKKLADKDLDKFVFRLSSTAEKKTSIIEELKRLDIKPLIVDKNLENDQVDYRLQINKIRRYGKILDSEYFEIKKTGYEILTNVAKYKSYLEKFPKYFEEEPISKKAASITKDKFLKNLSQMEDVKSIISKINQKFKNISNHPWFGLIEEKNNPYELRDLKKTIIKLNEDSKIVNEKIINFFKFIKLKLDLDENNLKKIIDIFSKAKESN